MLRCQGCQIYREQFRLNRGQTKSPHSHGVRLFFHISFYCTPPCSIRRTYRLQMHVSEKLEKTSLQLKAQERDVTHP